TMIYVTHDQVEAMTLADKIVVLRAGVIEQVGAPMDLYRDPDNRFVAGFIGSPPMNFMAGVVKAGKVEIPALGQCVETAAALPSDGSEVIVGLRPEHLRIEEGGALTVTHAEALGGLSYAYVEAPTGERLVVEDRGEREIKAGTKVALAFDSHRVFLFDANSERRLR
ncbi:MAG: TOBE domain-containing protein, partial [Shimia sp.]